MGELMNTAEMIERASIERPLNWSELSSSAKDLWEARQLRSIAKREVPLDVWCLFDAPEDEEPSHEANIYYTTAGQFRAAWYNTSVGLVTTREFVTYDEAAKWLSDAGYQDFSS